MEKIGDFFRALASSFFEIISFIFVALITHTGILHMGWCFFRIIRWVFSRKPVFFEQSPFWHRKHEEYFLAATQIIS